MAPCPCPINHALDDLSCSICFSCDVLHTSCVHANTELVSKPELKSISKLEEVVDKLHINRFGPCPEHLRTWAAAYELQAHKLLNSLPDRGLQLLHEVEFPLQVRGSLVLPQQ